MELTKMLEAIQRQKLMTDQFSGIQKALAVSNELRGIGVLHDAVSKWQQQIERMSNPMLSAKSIGLMTALEHQHSFTQAISSSLVVGIQPNYYKALSSFAELAKRDLLFGRAENLSLTSIWPAVASGLIRATKSARIISDIVEKHRSFLYTNYDLSEIPTIVHDDEEQLIITPAQRIFKFHSILEDMKEIYRNPSKMFKLDPYDFEKIVAEMLQHRGYNVELTKRTRDGGMDIIALSEANGLPLKFLVECKRHSKKNRVGIDIVRGFCDVINTSKANKGIIFTTSYFTKESWKRRNANGYLLDFKDHDEIIAWVKNYVESI